LATPLESARGFTEMDVLQDLKAGEKLWAEAIMKLRKVRDRVARRYNAERKAMPFKVGDIVVYRVKFLSSKARVFQPSLGYSVPSQW
jgi:hypothetical protein